MVEVVHWPALKIADVKKAGIVDEAIGRPESDFGFVDRRFQCSKVRNVGFGKAMGRTATSSITAACRAISRSV
jgi:hypothetical protein